MPKSKIAAHTPGPWKSIWNGSSDIFTVSHNQELIATVGYPENAHLIAAAPELLEACKKAFDFIGIADTREKTFLRLALEAAISKAEGRE